MGVLSRDRHIASPIEGAACNTLSISEQVQRLYIHIDIYEIYITISNVCSYYTTTAVCYDTAK